MTVQQFCLDHPLDLPVFLKRWRLTQVQLEAYLKGSMEPRFRAAGAICKDVDISLYDLEKEFLFYRTEYIKHRALNDRLNREIADTEARSRGLITGTSILDYTECVEYITKETIELAILTSETAIGYPATHKWTFESNLKRDRANERPTGKFAAFSNENDEGS